ncbi:hypothetical protein OXYTRIMIC_612 [Oxytricha trifallax]|uniref:Uncharacterized protein n=1 Tax=Oxytricha trifallax TaxID=1172189 RepID=A0A073HZ99_9SPIT|nr:hypothetical protein OXYTRIMIC_612 [Oxytricha trifallax]
MDKMNHSHFLGNKTNVAKMKKFLERKEYYIDNNYGSTQLAQRNNSIVITKIIFYFIISTQQTQQHSWKDQLYAYQKQIQDLVKRSSLQPILNGKVPEVDIEERRRMMKHVKEQIVKKEKKG